MSHYEYKKSIEIERARYPFYAVLMAAMRQADTQNLRRLRAAFPCTWDELEARYHAPDGLLRGDEQPQGIQVVPADYETDIPAS